MDTLQKVVLIGHTLVAVLIIVLVLMQRGKGADAGAGFGAGASGTVFGARGSASFFSRATGVLAAVFFLSSLFLAYLSSQGPVSTSDSLLEGLEEAPVEEVSTDDVGGLPAVDAPAVEAEQAADDAVNDLPAVEPAQTADDEGAEQ